MRHRAPRSLHTLLLSLRHVRPWPRRAGWLRGRPSLRLACALASMLLLFTGGLVMAGEFADDTVPATDGVTTHDHRAPDPSRSSVRATWPTSAGTLTDGSGPARTGTRAPLPEEPDVASPESTPPEREPATQAREPRPQRTATELAEPPRPSLTPTPRLRTSSAVPEPSGLTTAPSSPDHDGRSGPTQRDSTTEPDSPTDDTPPQTTVDSGPASSEESDRGLLGASRLLDRVDPRQDSEESDDAEFTFHANERATFECSLDDEPFEPCESPAEYDDLESGEHEFRVRAVDDADNVDPTPDTWTWESGGEDD